MFGFSLSLKIILQIAHLPSCSNHFNLNCSGSVTVGTNWSGTATLNYTGAGTFAGATSASILSLNTTINTTGATFSTGFNYRTNKFIR